MKEEVSASWAEDTLVGTELGRVEAVGLDEGDVIRYAILSPPAALDLFAIDSRNGSVFLSRPLDFEAAQEHILVIEAAEEGDEEEAGLRAQAVFTLSVLDVNDNAPVFERTLYKASLLENATMGAKIFQVKPLNFIAWDG